MATIVNLIHCKKCGYVWIYRNDFPLLCTRCHTFAEKNGQVYQIVFDSEAPPITTRMIVKTPVISLCPQRIISERQITPESSDILNSESNGGA
jgi:hypothetical protein